MSDNIPSFDPCHSRVILEKEPFLPSISGEESNSAHHTPLYTLLVHIFRKIPTTIMTTSTSEKNQIMSYPHHLFHLKTLTPTLSIQYSKNLKEQKYIAPQVMNKNPATAHTKYSSNLQI